MLSPRRRNYSRANIRARPRRTESRFISSAACRSTNRVNLVATEATAMRKDNSANVTRCKTRVHVGDDGIKSLVYTARPKYQDTRFLRHNNT